MSWEISHTAEAWENVEQRLSFKKWIAPMRRALVIDDVIKWKTDEDDQRYEAKVIRESNVRYKAYSHQQLVEETMNRVRDHRTCSNGGHEFYLDREGRYSVSCDDIGAAQRNKLPYWAI